MSGRSIPITTLDPLFADNNSAKRTLQIVYEGLVRYNGKEEIIPGIAERWEVSDDSLRYGFVLNDNLYYHDNAVFSNGVGRKVVAGDVKFAFERWLGIACPPMPLSFLWLLKDLSPTSTNSIRF
ncbi:MAG: ABC transporter substrate-binding protein [Balneolaceae bacterium]|nr:ABC transporter substrate-binding protein [Balneolaceae bacterium]